MRSVQIAPIAYQTINSQIEELYNKLRIISNKFIIIITFDAYIQQKCGISHEFH